MKENSALYMIQEAAKPEVILNLEAARAFADDEKNKYNGVKFEAVLQVAEEVNQNRRSYAKRSLNNGLKGVQHLIDSGTWFGESDHPMSKEISRFATVSMGNVSHRILETRWEGNKLIGLCETLQTGVGKDMKGLLLSGVKVGFSMRGLGKVTRRSSDGVSHVEGAMRTIAYDHVSNPSHIGAMATSLITESEISDFITTSSQKLDLLRESLSEETGKEIELVQSQKGVKYDFKENTAMVCLDGSCMKVFLEDHIKEEFNSSFRSLIEG